MISQVTLVQALNSVKSYFSRYMEDPVGTVHCQHQNRDKPQDISLWANNRCVIERKHKTVLNFVWHFSAYCSGIEVKIYLGHVFRIKIHHCSPFKKLHRSFCCILIQRLIHMSVECWWKTALCVTVAWISQILTVINPVWNSVSGFVSIAESLCVFMC